MKRILLLALVVSIGFCGYSQTKLTVPNSMRNMAVKMEKPTAETMNFSHDALPANKALWPPEEEVAGTTWYDLQTNSGMETRLAVYADGTIGATYTFGVDYDAFADRGTGYNYFDGNSWGPFPTARIESDRTGWPAYAAWGEGGEINVAHYSGAAVGGLAIYSRATKGTGAWTSNILHSPEPLAEYLWPRCATAGVNNSVLHVISITMPVANGGVVYQGMDGALLYSRSSDGGATWDVDGYLPDEINSNYYNGITADIYEVQARDNTVAILWGDNFADLGLLKSTDGGDTWTKTLIWTCPYPLWVLGTPTDTFYCADGDHALAIDQTGMVHVAFGINRAVADATTSYYFPLVGGVGYWNETRPVFSSGLNSLNPYGEAGTELVDDYSLIDYPQDLNGNGTWDILGEGGLYYVGACSMPQIVVDDQNRVFVVSADLTEGYNNGTQDYRHLWARGSNDLGETWGDFYDLTSELIHIFDECVFPSTAVYSDDYFYLLYQLDNEPGLAVRGDLDPYGENKIQFMKVLKSDLITTKVKENDAIKSYDVSQNSPNPFSTSSVVSVNVRKACNLSLEISNMMGQVVYTKDAGFVGQGLSQITIDGSKLSSGIYFYTVKAGDAAVSKKMMVK